MKLIFIRDYALKCQLLNFRSIQKEFGIIELNLKPKKNTTDNIKKKINSAERSECRGKQEKLKGEHEILLKIAKNIAKILQNKNNKIHFGKFNILVSDGKNKQLSGCPL